MSVPSKNSYQKPKIGFLRFDDRIPINPSQGGGIIGGGDDNPFDSISNPVEQILPDISNDRIESIENIGSDVK